MNIQTFGGRPDGSDTTLAVRRALESAHADGETCLVFPTGEYHFWPDRAQERYLFVSNNDESLKRLIFVLDDFEDFEIDGQNSHFVFHGALSPFFLSEAKNIRLNNFSVDWARSFHSEARVLAVSGNAVDLEIPFQFPYKIERRTPNFHRRSERDFSHRQRAWNSTQFAARRRFKSPTTMRLATGIARRKIGPRQVRLWAEWATVPTPGNVLVLMSCERFCPAIIISDSQNIEIENVTLHHAGGMGVIAQCSRDLTLREVRVFPREDSGRMVSLTADATHFVCCEGQIITRKLPI